MSNGGRRLKDLIRQRGFKLGAVADAIGVHQNTMTNWIDTAPIDKLFRLSDFTGIPILEVIECFRPHDDPIDIDQAQIDRTGGDRN
jgi:predicted transcriptional regulator